MLEAIAKFLSYVIFSSGIIANILIGANTVLMLTRRSPAYKRTMILDPMAAFILLFAVSVLVYVWLHA